MLDIAKHVRDKVILVRKQSALLRYLTLPLYLLITVTITFTIPGLNLSTMIGVVALSLMYIGSLYVTNRLISLVEYLIMKGLIDVMDLDTLVDLLEADEDPTASEVLRAINGLYTDEVNYLRDRIRTKGRL